MKSTRDLSSWSGTIRPLVALARKGGGTRLSRTGGGSSRSRRLEEGATSETAGLSALQISKCPRITEEHST